MAASTVSSWVPPSLPESAAASGLVLLDRWCYIADLPNTTTAESTTSSGLRIQVTFRAARPPLASHFCVHCPGLDDFRSVGPMIVATDADLVLLCVPVGPCSTFSESGWDYFVYNPRARWLDLLPNPHDTWRGIDVDDSATALISRDGGARYAVASLRVRPPLYDGRELVSWEFDLHLYRSKGRWIRKRLSVTEFARDRLIPLPRGSDRLYHETGKTITVGGEHGTVAWVDLWRGVFLCDVLKKRPRLRDVPLPEPARGNWDRLRTNLDPGYVRDVTISRNRDAIKYVELEILWREELIAAATTPDSYADWVRELDNNTSKSRIIPDGWKSTTWSMAMPAAGSREGWRRDCAVDVKDVNLEAGDDPCLSDLVDVLSSKTARTFKELPVGYPILSMDDDVVYLLCQTRTRHMDKLAAMFAVDARTATLRGLAELDAEKSNICMPSFCISEICRGT